MELARAFAEAQLPRDQHGRLLPLNCPLHCFQVFGAGVYTYMAYCHLMRNVFFFAFLFALSNMIHNITGGAPWAALGDHTDHTGPLRLRLSTGAPYRRQHSLGLVPVIGQDILTETAPTL